MSALVMALSLATAPAPCEPLPAWEDVANEAHGKYLIFGEAHGSAEAPDAVAEYVCAVAEEGPVLLAIEFSAATDDGFQRAWAASVEKFRETLFAEIPEWGQRQDGVASGAMLSMLERLHVLKSSGRAIDIVAFNGAKNDAQRAAFAELPGQESHEAAQAANIREAAQMRAYRHVVVLVGGLHAQKFPTTVGSHAIRPMAMLLDRKEQVISLRMNTAGGESWSCQLREGLEIDPSKPVTDEMIDCRAYSEVASREVLERGLYLDDRLYPGRYDGAFALGPITASAPAAID